MATKTKTNDKPSAPKTEKKAKKSRPVFDLASAKGADGATIALDDEKRLTGVPVNWESGMEPLKRQHFTNRATYFEFKAQLETQKISDIEKRREEWLERAKEARTGTPSTKRKLAKLAKMRDQLAELEEALKQEGVEIND